MKCYIQQFYEYLLNESYGTLIQVHDEHKINEVFWVTNLTHVDSALVVLQIYFQENKLTSLTSVINYFKKPSKYDSICPPII